MCHRVRCVRVSICVCAYAHSNAAKRIYSIVDLFTFVVVVRCVTADFGNHVNLFFNLFHSVRQEHINFIYFVDFSANTTTADGVRGLCLFCDASILGFFLSILFFKCLMAAHSSVLSTEKHRC